jgi:hypothetical protein
MLHKRLILKHNAETCQIVCYQHQLILFNAFAFDSETDAICSLMF